LILICWKGSYGKRRRSDSCEEQVWWCT